MKALAARRRSRFAPVVVVLLALMVIGTIMAVMSPGRATAEGPDEDTIAAGRELFQANCASCHGMQGGGNDLGPSLVGVGAASVDFQMATGRMPMAHNQPQVETGPPQFDPEQISQVAAYVSTLGPGPAIPTAEMVDPELGDPAEGMLLFRTNCAMCHNAVGAGGALTEGKFAPGLYDSTPTEIYEAMLTGPQSMPVFSETNIDSEGKRDVIAYLYEQRDGTPGGMALGSLGPVSEGMWVWIIGMGGLIAIAVWIGAKSS